MSTPYVFTVKVGVAAAISMAAAIAILLYISLEQSQDLIAFSVLVIGGAAAIYAAFYAGRTLHENTERAAKDRAFDSIWLPGDLPMNTG